MNTEEIIFDNLLDTSVDGSVFLEDLIEDPASNVLEQAMKENMVLKLNYSKIWCLFTDTSSWY